MEGRRPRSGSAQDQARGVKADCPAGRVDARASLKMPPDTLSGGIFVLYFILAYGEDTRQHPQLLHHRACGPRKDDAQRPHPRTHEGGAAARTEGTDARRDGPGARARHHDQEPPRLDDVPREGREALPLQPHRHARTRRLRLRGEPFDGRVRGRALGRGRRAGRGGADRREHLLRAGRAPGDRARPQQGRPARRGRGGRLAAGGGHPRDPDGRAPARLREDGRGVPRRAGGHREAHPAAEDARRRCAPPGPRLRLRLR